jgi:hypothetical protein
VVANQIDSSICSLSDAPTDISNLARHWHGLCGDRKFPARGDIDPLNLRDYIGSLCILEVRADPLDYVYRLFGSFMTEYLGRDLTGKSILELPPVALGRHLFGQIEDAINAAAPMYFRTLVAYDRPARKSGSHRIILPLSTDGVTIDSILTYTRFDHNTRDFWSKIPD